MKHWKVVLATGRRLNSSLTSARLGSGELGGNQDRGAIVKTLFSKDSTTITYKTSPGPSFPQEHANGSVTVSFSNLFLRDASQSARSVDASSGQKLFRTGQLVANPSATVPQRVEITPDKQAVHIDWGDGDTYDYPLAFLKQFSGGPIESQGPSPLLWDRASLKENIGNLLSVNYASFASKTSSKGLYQTLANCRKFGISFIADLPQQRPELQLKKVVEPIGPIRHTFYGEIFDVKTKPGAENIAYTNHALALHQDLLYMDNAPGWQILHAIKNSSDGSEAGMNYFADAFSAARFVRDTDADAYEALTQVPINYHYKRNDNRYYNSRPLIVENEISTDNLVSSNYVSLIKEVNYSPMFQAPFTFGIWDKPKGQELSTPSGKLTQRLLFKDFLRGLALFEKFINMPENQFRLKLPENACVIFNNRRLLHARTAFSGERWLRGCYLDDDALKSRLAYLEERDQHH
ncbi:LAME_0F07690g1_1 [Lachancea meyersii CBS 8951]|uniref:LAME_0F07690g1_1 n=1 Tax=Lachancea meyersii CBS 8951 TaxID=1266667 RepID=A0A1G4JUE2_9SACH|nr:LAME_0F07690g1_1 [Lachancea meyersii CBS 8951]